MSRPPSSLAVPTQHQSFPAGPVLPGEDPEEFLIFRRQLRDELRPVGSIERSHFSTIAHLLWRKDRLGVFRVAEQARLEFSEFFSDGDIFAGTLRALQHRLEKDVLRLERFVKAREFGKETKKAMPELSPELDEIEKSVVPGADQEVHSAKVHADVEQELAKERTENQFAILGDLISPGCFLQELEFRERLDAALERAFERLARCQARRLSEWRGRRRSRWGSVRFY
jgi:hypothetical protein